MSCTIGLFTVAGHWACNVVPAYYVDSVNATNNAVIRLEWIVKRYPFDVFDQLTNGAMSDTDRLNEKAALIIGAEHATNLLTRLLCALHNSIESCVSIAPILPLVGKDGMEILASGLTNSNLKVRATCASNVTWPLVSINNIEVTFVNAYRSTVDEYAFRWVSVLYDTNKTVASGAAMGLLYVSSNRTVLDGLEKAMSDTNRDARLRRTESNTFRSVSLQKPGAVGHVYDLQRWKPLDAAVTGPGGTSHADAEARSSEMSTIKRTVGRNHDLLNRLQAITAIAAGANQLPD